MREGQIVHAMDLGLCATPARWSKNHKGNMGNCEECVRMMRLQFEFPIIKMEDVYSSEEDLHRHLARWNQVWGVKPRPEWVHMFIHTLGKVPT